MCLAVPPTQAISTLWFSVPSTGHYLARNFGGGFAERHLIRDLARASQYELCVFPLAARATRFFYGGVAGVTRGVT